MQESQIFGPETIKTKKFSQLPSSLSESPVMGDNDTRFRGLSIAPRVGVGFITDAKLLNFNSPFPQSTTRLIGGELTVDFGKLSNDTHRRIGELALLYYWGHSEDQFTQDDLPLANNPLAGLIRFSTKRESDSHYLFAEWRWPSFAPVWSNNHWAFINPQFGVGAGGILINTKITQGDDNPTTKNVSAVALAVTGSTQVRLVEFAWGDFRMSLEGSVRLFAGQALGMAGEGALRFSWSRF